MPWWPLDKDVRYSATQKRVGKGSVYETSPSLSWLVHNYYISIYPLVMCEENGNVLEVHPTPDTGISTLDVIFELHIIKMVQGRCRLPYGVIYADRMNTR